jgi:hypothetical protein
MVTTQYFQQLHQQVAAVAVVIPLFMYLQMEQQAVQAAAVVAQVKLLQQVVLELQIKVFLAAQLILEFMEPQAVVAQAQ